MAKILVADDARVVRMLLRTWLERMGHVVVEVGDGASVIAALRDASVAGAAFDLALCDINMPTLSGLQVLDAARGDAVVKTPIVLVTTLGSPSDKDRGHARGAAAYLTKPVTFQALSEALVRLGIST
jgi:CheY-like chemotaxis protein